jgi:hypothetical protein
MINSGSIVATVIILHLTFKVFRCAFNKMTSLRDVCFEQIQDQYWYGLYGDFKIIIDKDTGYFNATKLCQDGGKEFKY